MRARVGPQHIARMTVAVHSQHANIAGALECALHAFEREIHHGLPRCAHVVRHEAVRQQEVARLVAEGVDVERGTFGVVLRLPDRMDAADKTPQPFERIAPVEIRRAAAAPFEDRETETVEGMQRAAFESTRAAPPESRARRDRRRRRVLREWRRRSSARADRTWRPPAGRLPRRPGTRGSRSC